MTADRFETLTSNYSKLRLAVIGDICLDRYLEIDPGKEEISIETGLPVRNVTRIRSQPGAGGTILNNLAALGIGEIYAVGFCGQDGEGFELLRSLQSMENIRLDHFFQTEERRTFTYVKPLMVEPGKTPVELNRLDIKNWSPTPADVVERLRRAVEALAELSDGFILMDQVDIPETGVVSKLLLETIAELVRRRPDFLVLADSRRSLRGFPPVTYKMNSAEFRQFLGTDIAADLASVKTQAGQLARALDRRVFVTLAEKGMIGAAPSVETAHAPALPVHGEIDIVGAGDSVTANLAAALAAGANLRESLELAMAAASIVVHKLGTTGTASVDELHALLSARPN